MRDILELERSLLGQVIADPGRIDEFGISEQLFYTHDFRVIFTAVEAVRGRGLVVDLVSIGDELSRSSRGDLLATLASVSGCSIGNSAFYAEKLRERLRRDKITQALREGLESLGDETKSAGELWDQIAASGVSAMRCIPEPEAPTLRNVLPDYLVELGERSNRQREGRADEVGFGIRELDALSGPLRSGEVVVIAARPGCGKTALALQTARYVAVNLKKPVAFFSLEMRREEVLDRLFALEGVASVARIRGGYLRDGEIAYALTAGNRLTDSPLSIFDGPHGLGLLRSRIRREKAVHGLSVAFIDYLGLLDLGAGGKAPRWERIGEVSRALKLLALELGIVIVLCVQLNREGDGTAPTLGMLRDSGSIEQDADRVLLLHASDGENVNGDRQITATLAKNRHGRAGKVDLLFAGDWVSFRGTGETA